MISSTTSPSPSSPTAARSVDARQEARIRYRETLGTLGTVLALVAATTGGSAAADRPPVAVSITARGCEPMDLTVPAGVSTFVITNRSSRALEWEILKGVMVIDERENIAPGFRARLTTKLDPGVYEITCGRLDGPRGRLTVTGTAAATTAADLIGPVAEYRVGTARRLADLTEATRRVRGAANPADRSRIEAALIEVRLRFLATAPLHPEVAAAAAAIEADLTAVEASAAGDPPADLTAPLARLEADVAAFTAAAAPLVVPADRLIATTVALGRRLADDAASEPAAPAALAEFEARRGAIERVVGLFAPLAARADPAGSTGLDDALAAARTAFAVPGPIAGFADARSLSPEIRRSQSAAARDLADRLAGLPGRLGL
jgi:hypothetical protein